MQAPQQNETIEAKRFVLRDEKGKTRGEFGMKGEEPTFRMFDKNENEQASLTIVKGCPMLSMNGYAGAAVLSFVEGAPSLFLSDAKGRSIIHLSVKADHTSAVLSCNGKPGLGLDVGDEGPQVTLFDSEGSADPRIMVHLVAGSPKLDLTGFGGKSFASLSVQENKPTLTLCENENMSVAQLTSGKGDVSLVLGGPEQTSARLSVTKNTAQLRLFNDRENEQVRLSLEQERSGLVLCNPEGEARAGLAVTDRGQLALMDEMGNHAFEAP